MSLIANLLRLLATFVAALFARQAMKGAEDVAKTGQDDEGGIRG